MKKLKLTLLIISLSLGLNAQTIYCSAGGGQDEYISYVEFASISNTSSTAGYTDFTNISTDLIVSQNFPITVNNGSAYQNDQCAVWIDWNQDFDFDDPDEFYVLDIQNGGASFTSSITVPATALLGQTTMRIRLMYVGNLSPCGYSTWGEVEDYSINVLPDCEAYAQISYFDFGLSVDFSVSSTQNVSYDTSLFAINWDLGDGTTNNYQSAFNHTYASPGTYLVTFSVEDLNDSTCFDYDSLYIDASSCEANAEFNFDITANDANFYTYFPYDSTSYNIVWDMGDGNFMTGQDSINYLFDTTDIFTVSLSVTDLNDSTCTDTVSYDVEAFVCDLDIDFSYDVFGDVASFVTDPAYENEYTISWDFGDGQSEIGLSSAYHYYFTQGYFTVTLVVTNNLYPLCSDTVSHEILLNNCYASAGFSYQSFGLEYFCSAGYTSAGYFYIWDFDDGVIDSTSGSSVDHIFPYEDNYDVTLIVGSLNDSLCADTVTITIQADSCAALAYFDFTATELDVDFNTVLPYDTSHYSLMWDFGDTTFASGLSPSHTYLAEGTYDVTLTVENLYDSTCFDSFTQSITVYDCSYIVSDFSYIDNGNFNFDFVLDNSYSSAGYQIFWNFGDGTTTYGTDNINYTYSSPGQYTAYATVTSLTYPYCSNYSSIEVCALDASFSFQTDTLTAMFSVDYNYDPLVYDLEWDFGDGVIVQNIANPEHTYTQEDTFQVSLTVTSIYYPNCNAVFTQDVFVTDCPLVANYSYVIDSMTVNFSSVYSPSEFILFWDFGDGATTVGLPNVTHTYTDYGTYSACLLVTDIDNSNCFDEKCYDITFTNSIAELIAPFSTMNIFPNPVNDILYIQFTDKKSSKYYLEIFDATGKKLMNETLNSQPGENLYNIDVNNLPKAVYYFRIKSDNLSAKLFKFVK